MLVPKMLTVVDLGLFCHVSDVVFHLLPPDLHRKHDVTKGIIGNQEALPLLKDRLQFPVFLLRLCPVLSLLIADSFQKTKLIFYLKLNIFDSFLVYLENWRILVFTLQLR